MLCLCVCWRHEDEEYISSPPPSFLISYFQRLLTVWCTSCQITPFSLMNKSCLVSQNFYFHILSISDRKLALLDINVDHFFQVSESWLFRSRAALLCNSVGFYLLVPPLVFLNLWCSFSLIPWRKDSQLGWQNQFLRCLVRNIPSRRKQEMMLEI